MIGFSLVAEGFGYAIPKGYLYAAIGFSIMIEMLNQFAQFNRRKFLKGSRPLRERTAEAVLRILSGKTERGEFHRGGTQARRREVAHRAADDAVEADHLRTQVG